MFQAAAALTSLGDETLFRPAAASLLRLIALAVLLCAGLRGSAAELVIDVFSGLPNPTLTLAESAVTHVWSKLDEASPAPAQDPATVFPARLDYRCVVILHWPAGQTTDSVLRIRGQDILETCGTEQRWFRAPDVSLEPYLVDLAYQKGAINAEL